MKNLVKVLSVVGLLWMAQTRAEEIVEFHILYGTLQGAWNTEATVVETKVGQTLRIINDDQIVHRLHTNGAPCSHGPDIAPGKFFDCKLTKAYSKAKNGDLYDHHVGPTAPFYLITNP